MSDTSHLDDYEPTDDEVAAMQELPARYVGDRDESALLDEYECALVVKRFWEGRILRAQYLGIDIEALPEPSESLNHFVYRWAHHIAFNYTMLLSVLHGHMMVDVEPDGTIVTFFSDPLLGKPCPLDDLDRPEARIGQLRWEDHPKFTENDSHAREEPAS